MSKARAGPISSFCVLICLPLILVPLPAYAQPSTIDLDGQPVPSEVDPVKTAQAFAEHLTNARYEKAAAMFDETVAKALPVEKLKEVWQSVQTSSGEFQSLGKPTTTQTKGYTSVVIPAAFKNTALIMMLFV